jgi:hypothetical protein
MSWNDNDRDVLDMLIDCKDNDNFISMHKILKDLYDEENEIMYINPLDSNDNFDEYNYDEDYLEDEEYYLEDDYNIKDSEYEWNIEDIGEYFENLVYNNFYYY